MAEMSPLLKARRLSSWTLKLMESGEVCVEGRLPDDGRPWHTTAIKAAPRPDLLQTHSGSHYILEGPIDRAESAKLSIAPALVRAFETGFPPDWDKLIAKHVASLRSPRRYNWYEDPTAGQSIPAAAFAPSQHFRQQKAVNPPPLTAKTGMHLSRIPRLTKDKENVPVPQPPPHTPPHPTPPKHADEEEEEEEEEVELAEVAEVVETGPRRRSQSNALPTPQRQEQPQTPTTAPPPNSPIKHRRLDEVAAETSSSSPRRSPRAHKATPTPQNLPQTVTRTPPATSQPQLPPTTATKDIPTPPPASKSSPSPSTPKASKTSKVPDEPQPPEPAATEEVRNPAEPGKDEAVPVVEVTSSASSSSESVKIVAMKESSSGASVQSGSAVTTSTSAESLAAAGMQAVAAAEPASSEKSAAAGEVEREPEDCRILYDWYLVAGANGDLCVEGLLAEEDRLYHSSGVREAVEPRLVVTHSGSRYFLRGPPKANQNSNYFPPHLVEYFHYGFPSNWRELMYNFVTASMREQNNTCLKWLQEAAVKYAHVAVAEEQEEAEVEKEKEKEEKMTPYCIVEMPPSDTEEVGEPSLVSSFKAPAPPKSPKTPAPPPMSLEDWSLILHDGRFVRVEGRLRGNAKRWSSNKIQSALGPDLVATKTGSRYRLHGRQNIQRSVHRHKFPPNLAEAFLDGFPPNWKRLVLKHSQEARPGRPQPSQHASLMSGFLQTTIASQAPPQARTKAGVSPSPLSVHRDFKMPQPRPKARQRRPPPEPIGKAERSRSGRVLRPPLASWAGERIVHSVDGEAVSHVTPAVDLTQPSFLGSAQTKRKSVAAKKKTKKQKQRRAAVVESSSSSEEEEEEEDEPSPPKVAKKAPVKWTQSDLKRLNLCLNAQRPELDDMEAWSRIARSIRPESAPIPPEIVQKKAIQVFGYDVRLANDVDQNEYRMEASQRLLSAQRGNVSSTSANASGDVFNSSVVPSLPPRVLPNPLLTSLAELSESDQSEALTPPRATAAFRSQRNFVPLPRRASVLSPDSSPAQAPPSPPNFNLSRTAAVNRFNRYRRGKKAQLNVSTAAAATAENYQTRGAMLSLQRDVERRIERTREPHSDFEEDEEEEGYEEPDTD